MGVAGLVGLLVGFGGVGESEVVVDEAVFFGGRMGPIVARFEGLMRDETLSAPGSPLPFDEFGILLLLFYGEKTLFWREIKARKIYMIYIYIYIESKLLCVYV